MILDIPDDMVRSIRRVRGVYGRPPWGGEWINLVAELATMLDEAEIAEEASGE